jgi:hypothetical protein
VDVIFLDFAKAFDSVPHQRLLLKLSAHGIKGKLLKWIKDFLYSRKQRVVMGNFISIWEMVLSGVPQGSVLGPILFIIFLNDFNEIISNDSKFYADDSKIIAQVNNLTQCVALQGDINNIIMWCTDWLISLNLNKCKVMHIGKHNLFYNYTIHKIDGTQLILESSNEERDLGVIIRSDLKWKTKVSYTCNKANAIIGLIKRTFSRINAQMIDILYKSYIRPHLEYANLIRCPYLKVDIERLEKIQRKVTKIPLELKDLS